LVIRLAGPHPASKALEFDDDHLGIGGEIYCWLTNVIECDEFAQPFQVPRDGRPTFETGSETRRRVRA
jgi:hypothetical protein